MFNNYAKTELELMVSKNEKILWKGKPNKRCFVLEGIFNKLLPFAMIWFIFDSFFLTTALKSNVSDGSLVFILIFILFHMLPVWLYLTGVIFAFKRYKNEQYIVTDKGVYVSGGLFSYYCDMKPFSELSRVNINRGIIDQIIGVGDIVLSSPSGLCIEISDIGEYRRVYGIIKKLQEDIYTDTMYPNDLRPKENHGYNTEYRGID